MSYPDLRADRMIPPRSDLALSLVVAVLGNWYMYLRYRPQFGIDDANITQVYASSLTQGNGFRYYAGGEVVEGSTSLLWTLINAVFFALSSEPEKWIAVCCFVACWATIHQTIRVVRIGGSILEADPWPPGLLVAVLFLLTPVYFAWAVWPLMDVSLWTLLFIAYVKAALAIHQERAAWLTLFACSALLPVTRPEGVFFAVAASAAGFTLAAFDRARDTRRWAVSFGLAVTATAAVTAWRTVYFGFPLPNTVYAKVSTGWLAQMHAGARYTLRFLCEPAVFFGVTALVVIAVWIAASHPTRRINGQRVGVVLMPFCFVLVTAGLYTAAGGDHFRHHRFFQPALPPLIASTALAAGLGIRRSRARASLACCVLAVVAAHGWTVWRFANATDLHSIEFRIAEEGRLAGAKLNNLDDRLSLGVVIAGGIARTYRGPIRDLMGLNWVEMAHAVSDKTGRLKNHGAFSKDVFFNSMPDIVIPRIAPCNAQSFRVKFYDRVLDGLTSDARFQDAYRPACFNGVVFYWKKSTTSIMGKLTFPNLSAASATSKEPEAPR